MENEQDPGLHNVPPLLCIPDNQCDVRRSNHILSCICLSQSLLLIMDTDQKTMPEVIVPFVTLMKEQTRFRKWTEWLRTSIVNVIQD